MRRSSIQVPATMLEQCRRAFASAGGSGKQPTIVSPVQGLRLLRHPVRTEFEATIYQPVLCLIVEGRKETTFGDRTFKLGAGHCLLVSHDLPVVSRIVEAPYLALLLDVDLTIVRGLYDELGPAAPGPNEARALEVHGATPLLLDALARYLALAGSATDAKALGPMLTREIHYRLLTAPFGGMLRSLLRFDSPASAVASAIAHLRQHFREPVVMAELARDVGLSVAAFHRQFKRVTSTSPLQYQKELRLLEARRMLRLGKASVSMAAFDVGYESPSQFSREYSRKFGRPPKSDVVKGDQPITLPPAA
jgi:AraC-like DNA-binding protein